MTIRIIVFSSSDAAILSAVILLLKNKMKSSILKSIRFNFASKSLMSVSYFRSIFFLRQILL